MSAGWERVGDAILAAYEQRGWKQADLAKESGVNAATIRKIERGHEQDYRSDVKRSIERALRWPVGSVDAIRRGEMLAPVNLPYDPAAPIDGPRTILAEAMMGELRRLGQLSADHAALFDQLLSDIEMLRSRLDQLSPEQGEAVP